MGHYYGTFLLQLGVLHLAIVAAFLLSTSVGAGCTKLKLSDNNSLRGHDSDYCIGGHFYLFLLASIRLNIFVDYCLSVVQVATIKLHTTFLLLRMHID